MAGADWDNGFFTRTREAHVVLTPDGVVLGWNPAAAEMLQITAEEAIGQLWCTLLPDLASLLPPAPEALRPSWQRQRAMRRDGTLLVVEATVHWHGGSWLLILADQRAFTAIEATAVAMRQRVLHLLDALPVVLATVSLNDDEFTVLYQNARGNETFGWTNDEWDRDPDFMLKILHPEDRERMTAFFAKARAAKADYEVEYRVLRPDGSVLWLWDMTTTVYDEAGAPDYWIECLVDVTAQQNAHRALQTTLHDLSAAHADVQALSAAKSDYLSFLSHEFRTPLTSIRGFSELIAQGDLPTDEAQQYAGIIDANAQRLSRMISRVLEMDRLASGLRRLDLREVRLEEIVHDALETIAGLAHTHEITLLMADGVPSVQADGDLLLEVLTNLLSNAIKYTPPDGLIRIGISTAHAGWAEVSVSDAGPGIPADKREAIFDRFTRLSRDERRQIEGSGLGLPIARQIVELHGGTLWADQVAQGARFVMRLPVEGPQR
ncbi:MAG: ATP-binding protein [Thermomicrobiales bacterium]